MGGTESTAVVDNISQQIANISMSSVLHCEVNIAQAQTLDFENRGIFVYLIINCLNMRHILALFFILCLFNSESQINILPNGDFELNSGCPNGPN